MGKSIALLVWASEASDFEPPFGDMFGFSAGGTCAPQSKGGGFQFRPHQVDHITRRKAELTLDRIEAGAIFPSHLDDPIDFRFRERFQVG
jgi:hypothetical protein